MHKAHFSWTGAERRDARVAESRSAAHTLRGLERMQIALTHPMAITTGRQQTRRMMGWPTFYKWVGFYKWLATNFIAPSGASGQCGTDTVHPNTVEA